MTHHSNHLPLVDPQIGDTIDCPGCKGRLTLVLVASAPCWVDGRLVMTCTPGTLHAEHLTTIREVPATLPPPRST